MKHSVKRRLTLLVILALAAAVAGSASSAGGGISVHARTPASGASLYQSIGQPLASGQGTVAFGCQTTTPAGCYGPDQIRAAYDIQPLLDRHLDGSGSTIVVIDPFGSPTLATDVANFDNVFGLPAPDLQVVTPFGVAPTDPGNAVSWSQETSLDIEWAHAVAPGATIVLVVAKSDTDSDILDATQWVLDHNAGDVVSQSYGEAEQCMAPSDLARQHALFASMSQQGITLLASTGDQGAGQYTCDGSAYFKAVSTPASDPYVTSVGGTTLLADGTTGQYQSESAWNEVPLFGDAAASGGGLSVVYSQPDYQATALNARQTSAHQDHGQGKSGGGGGNHDHGHSGMQNGGGNQDHGHGGNQNGGDSNGEQMRGLPDVSYNAAVFHGVITASMGDICGPAGPGTGTLPCFFRVGGTSAGSPQWAGLIAIADQLGHGRLGAINPALYQVGAAGRPSMFFHDIADGSSNTIPDLTPYLGAPYGTPINGYSAVPGYDLVTGLGSPIANRLIPWLAQNADRSGNNFGSTEGDNGSNGNDGHKHNH
ncbi:MAG: S53 family peptidase [Mycobacterium sp.]